MTISPIMGTSYYNPYGAYNTYAGPSASASYRQGQPTAAGQVQTSGSDAAARAQTANAEQAAALGMPGASEPSEDGRVIIRNPGESTEKQAGKKSSPAECETCKNRKYQDGSDVSDVSF